MPTAWAMDGLQNIVVRGLGLVSTLLPVGILISSAELFFVLAVRRFKYEERHSTQSTSKDGLPCLLTNKVYQPIL